LTILTSAQTVGATPLCSGGWQFRVWAPEIPQVALHLKSPAECLLPMHNDAEGFHTVEVAAIPADATYLYQLDGNEEWPDPASRWQPQGVHAPSQIVDTHLFHWNASTWKPLDLQTSVLYELHVGTYTPEGTFDNVISHLDELAELGVTTIEIMPVAQFPGARNWGYDGVYIFAPQNSYGGPLGLQRLVDAAHVRGLTVILDVVYNHLGPEGNYLGKFGPYFTDRYRTPWGSALNFDGAHSGPVRDFFISNALYWLEEFRIDGLRLDAIDGIRDFGAIHFLAELKIAVQELELRTTRTIVLIAESDMNDRKVLDFADRGGYALDAQWSDDFHHSLHTLLTKETAGYYADFGGLQHLASTFRQGWHYDGKPSTFRRRRHGNSPRGISSDHFVVYSQNHDQVGNRALADRLSRLVDLEGLKLAAGITLLSPFVPLLFMGEEYGETAPFLYFTSHEDAGLIDAVRKGRREEFAAFGWSEELPDPQSETTFASAQLQHALKQQDPHQTLRAFYKRLLALRRKFQLGTPAQIEVNVLESQQALLVLRKSSLGSQAMLFHFGEQPAQIAPQLPAGDWRIIFDSVAFSKSSDPPNTAISAPIALLPRSFVVLENIDPKSEQ
jgi:maltooligosyltrehalose trehalohydrolase